MDTVALSLQYENALLTGQKRILEMVATAAPLALTLIELAYFIESQEPGLRCSILIVGDDGEHFHGGYGPSLPESYHRALDGASIKPPYLGPSAESVHRNVTVAVTDAAHDERWSDAWREGVLSCGLAACRSTPVLASDGSVLACFAMYYDHPRDPYPTHPELIETATHLASIAIERQRMDTALRESRRANALLAALPVALYTTDAEGRVTFYNEAAAALWGHRPELGQSIWCGSWRLYWPDGRPMPHDECPMAVSLKEDRALHGEAWAERPDGVRIPFLAYPSPLHDGSGALIGAVNMLVDISERKHAEEQRTLLVNELNHRVKNTLSAVQSIAAQTLRNDNPSEALSRFEARLIALSKTHDTLTRNSWKDVSLRQLLEQELVPYCGCDGQLRRCNIEGADFRLTPKTALALGMAFHELATNAAKYGALSRPSGQVSVKWSLRRVTHATCLHLVWAEAGGPPVVEPQQWGFGSRLIQQGLAHELDGEVRMDFDPAGVVCTIDVPLAITDPASHGSSERMAVAAMP